MTEPTTSESTESENGTPSEEIIIRRGGQETTYDKEKGDFVDWEAVNILCENEEQCRDVGKVVSLLKRHNADDIRELVEAELGSEEVEA